MDKSRLKECPRSPNCVSTQTKQKDKLMRAITFSGEANVIAESIKSIITKLPHTKLISEDNGALHFTFTSRFFRFVDDVHFIIDSDKKLIHFRSASRTGYSDLGANRKRMTEVSNLILAEIKETSYEK